MRKRTRMLIVTGVCAVGLAPLGASAAAAPGSAGGGATDAASVLGPEGYRDLRLNMPDKQANATGLLVDRQAHGACTYYYLHPSAGSQPRGGGVFVSDTEGVVVISGTDRVSTPEGIGLDSTFAEVRNAYPGMRPVWSDWIFETPVPGNPGAKYRFAFSEAGMVSDFSLTADDTGGCAS